MRLFISHTTTYRYESPPNSVIQLLRLTPRHHDGQYVVRWRIDLSQDCRLDQREDAFGNIVQAFTMAAPVEEIAVQVEGEVETQDTAGIIRGTVERFPPSLFLRSTELTEPDGDIGGLAEAIAGRSEKPLDRLHFLLADLHESMAFDPDPTQVHTTAAEAYALKRGVCQDITHVFLSAARLMGIPARYIGGHMHRLDGQADQAAGHAWAEAYVDGLGWVAFDPTNGLSATDRHIRIAVGLDYLGAAPVRGSRYGGGEERLSVNVRVGEAPSQGQVQGQGQTQRQAQSQKQTQS